MKSLNAEILDDHVIHDRQIAPCEDCTARRGILKRPFRIEEWNKAELVAELDEVSKRNLWLSVRLEKTHAIPLWVRRLFEYRFVRWLCGTRR